MMGKIPSIVIVIILAGLALFIWHTGFLGKLGGFKFPTPNFSNIAPHIPPVGPSAPGNSSSAGLSRNPPPASYGKVPPSSALPYTPPQIATSEILQGFTRNQLSTYFKKVTVGSAYAGSGYAGSYGQIVLYANLSQGGSVNVTGWTLKGNRGNEYIPQAVNVYDPSGLTAPTDIVLHSGDQLSIYSTTSPIGQNLHLNECIGYITNTAKFNPPLYATCPAPSQDVNLSSLSGQCENYIQTLGSCALPRANPPVPQNDYACQNFLDTINYKGCFDRHRSDTQFLSNQWIVWTGSDFLDRYHDRVLLLDKNGLLVDAYSY